MSDENEKENEHKKPSVNPLLRWVQNNLASGAVSFKAKGASDDDWFNVVRDLNNALPVIVQTAGNLTYIQVTGNKDQEERTYYLMQLCANIFSACVTDNVKGLSLFSELYDELDKDEELAKVWQLFSGYFVQSVYAYMFTTRTAAIGTIDKNSVGDMTMLHTLLNDIDDEADRKTVVSLLQKHEIWPLTLPTREYRVTLKDFRDAAQQDWEAWELKNRGRENAGNPNKVKVFKAT